MKKFYAIAALSSFTLTNNAFACGNSMWVERLQSEMFISYVFPGYFQYFCGIFLLLLSTLGLGFTIWSSLRFLKNTYLNFEIIETENPKFFKFLSRLIIFQFLIFYLSRLLLLSDSNVRDTTRDSINKFTLSDNWGTLVSGNLENMPMVYTLIEWIRNIFFSLGLITIWLSGPVILLALFKLIYKYFKAPNLSQKQKFKEIFFLTMWAITFSMSLFVISILNGGLL